MPEIKTPKPLSNWLENKILPLLSLNTPYERWKMRQKINGQENNNF